MPTIFSKDLLFLHVPKTGGTSVSQLLLSVLPRPVFYVHPTVFLKRTDPGVVHIAAISHHPLDRAEAIVRQHGFELDRFPAILAVIRNPYELAVSHYAFLRRPTAPTAQQSELARLAIERDFSSFVVEAVARRELNFMGRLHDFYHLRGAVPPNLRIVRFEHLAEGVGEVLRDIGVQHEAELLWLNRSTHDDYATYYDRAAENAVFAKQRWMFDEGFYGRMIF
jgi:hypothetical protein